MIIIFENIDEKRIKRLNTWSVFSFLKAITHYLYVNINRSRKRRQNLLSQRDEMIFFFFFEKIIEENTVIFYLMEAITQHRR